MEALKTIVIKYGGNAMINSDLQGSVLKNVCELSDAGYQVVIVHGGGPFINSILKKVGVSSDFIGGHRKTTPEAMKYIEMALLGEVNTGLVSLLNSLGKAAVGLSGKDAGMVKLKKRFHLQEGEKIDLGQVGDVVSFDPTLLTDLMRKQYLPVIGCVAADQQGISYNINADMMAGAVAGALKADAFCVLTDVDGLREDKDDPGTLIKKLACGEIEEMMNRVIVGGMIPKIESCQIALDQGAKKAMILNGTRPASLKEALLEEKNIGTVIEK